MKLTPPLKWHGGKQYLAKRIIELMPAHTHYVEPFFGGGAVLLNKDPEGISEVVNDINGVLMNFWRVLQNPFTFETFFRCVEGIPFSEVEWCDAKEDQELHELENSTDVNNAIAFFIWCRQSRAGMMKDFATLSRNRTRRGMNEQVSSWLNCIEGLSAVHARLKRVVILNQSANAVIKQQDGPNTLFYLDPPYLHETRTTKDAYSHEMGAWDHMKLIKLIQEVKGKVIISGYPSEVYQQHLDDWNFDLFDLPNNAAGGASKQRMMECVWYNF